MNKHGDSLVGKYICKTFIVVDEFRDEEDFVGTITSYDPIEGLYHATYNDQDEEDLTVNQVLKFIKRYSMMIKEPIEVAADNLRL